MASHPPALFKPSSIRAGPGAYGTDGSFVRRDGVNEFVLKLTHGAAGSRSIARTRS